MVLALGIQAPACPYPTNSTGHLTPISVYHRGAEKVGDDQGDSFRADEPSGGQGQASLRGKVANAPGAVGLSTLAVARCAEKAAGFFLSQGPAGFGAGRAFPASCAGSHRGFPLADAATLRTGT